MGSSSVSELSSLYYGRGLDNLDKEREADSFLLLEMVCFPHLDFKVSWGCVSPLNPYLREEEKHLKHLTEKFIDLPRPSFSSLPTCWASDFLSLSAYLLGHPVSINNLASPIQACPLDLLWAIPQLRFPSQVTRPMSS